MEKPSDPELESIYQSFNTFGIDILKQVAGGDENSIFSPFSIAMALAMTCIGAKSTTATEIAGSLHLSVPVPTLSKAMPAIMKTMRANDPRGKNLLLLANALWMKQGYPILENYRDAIRGNFKGDLFEVAFSAGEAVCDKINAWVAKQTNNKISQLLAPGALNPESVLVLTNAIYFLGAWLHMFPARNTKMLPFYPVPGQDTKVATMHVEATFGYLEDPNVQYLEMPYVGEDLAMGIVLPKRRNGLSAVQGRLSAEYLGELATGASEQQVNVFLPQFKLESTFDLTTGLGVLGIKAAFQRLQADFSGISSDPAGVFISAVIHKAFVDVSEKGTEAAAATAVVMLPSCAPGEVSREPPTFRADHPFLFLIRHSRLNVILFMGKVILPQGKLSQGINTKPAGVKIHQFWDK